MAGFSAPPCAGADHQNIAHYRPRRQLPPRVLARQGLRGSLHLAPNSSRNTQRVNQIYEKLHAENQGFAVHYGDAGKAFESDMKIRLQYRFGRDVQIIWVLSSSILPALNFGLVRGYLFPG
jgi:hypothetical protein